MGRIEDALRRAGARKGGGTPDQPSSAKVEEPPIDAKFVSPWHAGDAIPEGPRPAPRISPRARPRVGERVRGLLPEAPSPASPSLQLDSLMAMGWPQPFAPEVTGKLVVMRETDPAAVGEYRKLAETVRQAQVDRGVKSVLVTSAIPGEGATLTAINLALTLSQLKGRVLLVDANTQHPHVHHVFQASAAPGLSECLKSDEDMKPPVVEIMSSLALLPAGTSGVSSSSLGSEGMRRVLVEAGRRFDWVVVDGPPVTSTPETALLAGLVDTAILVVQADRTPTDAVTQAIETLGRARVIGVVLNRAGHKAVAEEARHSA